MEYRELGRTGLSISRVTLGCGNFGGIGSPAALIGHGLDEAAALATMDEAAALGITLFDTAFSYAGGASETMIGRWLALQPEPAAARVRIATKVGTIVSTEGTRTDLSPPTIRRHLETSLRRLGLAHVDFCLAHAPDERTPIESTLEGFAAAAEAGMAAHFGLCNVNAQQLLEALAAGERLGLPRVEWVQNAFSLMNRDDEQELFAICRERGLGYTPFSPMAGGVLTGKYRRNQAPPADSRLGLRPDGQVLSPAVFDAIDALRERAMALGVSCGALSLAWAMSHPEVTSVIVGPAKAPEHLRVAREVQAVPALDERMRSDIASLFASNS